MRQITIRWQKKTTCIWQRNIIFPITLAKHSSLRKGQVKIPGRIPSLITMKSEDKHLHIPISQQDSVKDSAFIICYRRQQNRI